MLIELCVRSVFEASHSLAGVFPGHHQCAKPHGHRYEVKLAIGSESDDDVLVDYHELHDGLTEIVGEWDHEDLEKVFTPQHGPSTCENLVRVIMSRAEMRWPGIVLWAEVKEQADTFCRAYGDKFSKIMLRGA